MQKIILMLLVLILCFVVMPMQAFAADDISAPSKFNGRAGDAEYMGEDFRDNYHLDIEELGILDAGPSILNSLANVLFNLQRLIVFLTVTLFYHAMSLDLGSLLSTAINTIQSGLMDSIFNTLFFLAVAACMWQVGILLAKRNLQAVIGELGRVILVMGLAIGVTMYSSSFLTTINTITKGISVSALGGVSGEGFSSEGNYTEDINEYSAQAAGMLWGNMLHRPWVSLEFYNYGKEYMPSQQDLTAILGNSVNDNARKTRIEQLNNQYGLFDKDVSSYRIGFLILLIVLVILKSAIFLVISALQLGMQVMSMLVLLFCPIVLLLSIVPQLGGLSILGAWSKKLLEIQLSIVILSFFLGIILRVDELLYNTFSASMGWAVVLLLQGMIYLAIILFRKDILQMFSNISRGMQNPGLMRRHIQRSGNFYESALGVTPRLGAAAYRRNSGGLVGQTVSTGKQMAETAARATAGTVKRVASLQYMGEVDDIVRDKLPVSADAANQPSPSRSSKATASKESKQVNAQGRSVTEAYKGKTDRVPRPKSVVVEGLQSEKYVPTDSGNAAPKRQPQRQNADNREQNQRVSLQKSRHTRAAQDSATLDGNKIYAEQYAKTQLDRQFDESWREPQIAYLQTQAKAAEAGGDGSNWDSVQDTHPVKPHRTHRAPKPDGQTATPPSTTQQAVQYTGNVVQEQVQASAVPARPRSLSPKEMLHRQWSKGEKAEPLWLKAEMQEEARKAAFVAPTEVEQYKYVPPAATPAQAEVARRLEEPVPRPSTIHAQQTVRTENAEPTQKQSAESKPFKSKRGKADKLQRQASGRGQPQKQEERAVSTVGYAEMEQSAYIPPNASQEPQKRPRMDKKSKGRETTQANESIAHRSAPPSNGDSVYVPVQNIEAPAHRTGQAVEPPTGPAEHVPIPGRVENQGQHSASEKEKPKKMSRRKAAKAEKERSKGETWLETEMRQEASQYKNMEE